MSTTTTETGLQIEELRVGTGDGWPQPASMSAVHHTGWLTNGSKFDSARIATSLLSFRWGSRT